MNLPPSTEQVTVNRYKWRLLDADLRSATPEAALISFAKYARPDRERAGRPGDDFNLGVKLAWRLAGMGKTAAAEQLLALLAPAAETDPQRRLSLEGARAAMDVLAGTSVNEVLYLHASRMGASFAEFAVPAEDEAQVGAALLRAVTLLGPRLSLQPQQRSEMDVRLITALGRAGLRGVAKEVAERSPVFGRTSAENDALRATLLQLAGETAAAEEIFERLYEARTLPVTAFLTYATLINQRGDANRAHQVLALAAENSDAGDILRAFAQSCLDRNDRATAAKIIARLRWASPRTEEVRELERTIKIRVS